MNLSMPFAANFARSDGVVIEAWVVSTTSGPLPVNSMNALMSALLPVTSLHAPIIKSANWIANKGLARFALDPEHRVAQPGRKVWEG
jgi:hypothetical protein